MSITFTEYQLEALRTIKPHASKTEAIADWTMGLLGEVAEVQEALLVKNWDEQALMELAKEGGDVLWYLTALMDELKLSMIHEDSFAELDSVRLAVNNPFANLLITAGKISELMKHYTMHKEVIDFDTVRHLAWDVLVYLNAVLGEHKIALSSAAELNAAKLAHRYNLKNGGEYNAAASTDRRSKEQLFKSTETYIRLHADITAYR